MTGSPKGGLRARLVVLMASVLLASSLLFLLFFLPLYRHELLQERTMASARLGAMLQIALENAMLKRDIPGLREIVRELGQTPSVDLAMIVEPKGEIRFSSDDKLIGQRRAPEGLCAGCQELDADGDRRAMTVTGFLRNERGVEVLRSVRAVPNREPCVQCHEDVAKHPVNGYLVVDYTAAGLTSRIGAIAALLSAGGLLVILASLAAVWFALRRIVIKPLAELAGAVSLSSGDEPHPIPTFPGRDDEIADLAQGWNGLVGRLGTTLRSVREHESFLQSVIDASPDALRVIADDYSVVAANAEFCRQAGRTLEQVLAAPCYASSHGRKEPCIPTLVVCPLIETRTRNERMKASHVHVDGVTGATFAVEVAAAQIVGGGRRLIVESIRNLSQQVQISHEQRLSELGHLASGVAHEIHNPLASVRLGLRAIERNLGETPQASETREFIAAVEAEVDRCITVTDRLMRLSRVPEERGALVDIEHVARDAMALLHYDAEACGVTMSLTIEGDVRVIADDADLGMILINLMQNGFHAMPKGGRLDIRAAATGDRDVTIDVADTGVGIASDQLVNIFHPFWSWRADGTRGSGLGLAICKASSVKWGGRIDVASTVGVGSTFRLTFPHAEKALDRA